MKIKTIILSGDIDRKDYLDAQAVIAIDGSVGDAEHDANIDKLIHLTRAVPVPFFAKGNIRTLEDVKKFLYAGVKKVILPPEQKELREAAAARFGSDKLMESEEEICEQHPALRFSDLKTDVNGLIPTVVQDYKTGNVLMVAYMNAESFGKTLETGRMTYYSRSRQELWEKGASSGHYQYMKSLTADCDRDTLLAKVAQLGAACHTGSESCFFDPVITDEYEAANPYTVLEKVYEVILDRKKNPKEGSYTNYLFDKGIDKILKKVGEEATEIVIAAKNPNPEEIKYEISDFLYHVMVLMAEKQVTWEDIMTELSNR